LLRRVGDDARFAYFSALPPLPDERLDSDDRGRARVVDRLVDEEKVLLVERSIERGLSL
jgi:hypothetical protein